MTSEMRIAQRQMKMDEPSTRGARYAAYSVLGNVSGGNRAAIVESLGTREESIRKIFSIAAKEKGCEKTKAPERAYLDRVYEHGSSAAAKRTQIADMLKTGGSEYMFASQSHADAMTEFMRRRRILKREGPSANVRTEVRMASCPGMGRVLPDAMTAYYYAAAREAAILKADVRFQVARNLGLIKVPRTEDALVDYFKKEALLVATAQRVGQDYENRGLGKLVSYKGGNVFPDRNEMMITTKLLEELSIGEYVRTCLDPDRIERTVAHLTGLMKVLAFGAYERNGTNGHNDPERHFRVPMFYTLAHLMLFDGGEIEAPTLSLGTKFEIAFATAREPFRAQLLEMKTMRERTAATIELVDLNMSSVPYNVEVTRDAAEVFDALKGLYGPEDLERIARINQVPLREIEIPIAAERFEAYDAMEERVHGESAKRKFAELRRAIRQVVETVAEYYYEK
ncbi:hypothetical protein HY990_04340 [Candidatus Micrarchaeota archaeon]|nr:hypothetical protein [Candidatus Micrarchaeota archaeon]